MRVEASGKEGGEEAHNDLHGWVTRSHLPDHLRVGCGDITGTLPIVHVVRAEHEHDDIWLR